MQRRPSIRDIGLKAYLDDTSLEHDGFGYLVFVKLNRSGLTPADIARAFKVSRQTAWKWVKIYGEEKAIVATKEAL